MKTFRSLSADEKKKCYQLMKKLRGDGKTYSEIQNFLVGKNINIGYATLYRNLKDVKMSQKGLLEHKKKISNSNRKKVFTKNIKVQKCLTEKKARLLSHCLFDGYVQGKGDWEISYCNISKILVNQFCNDLYDVYGIKPTIFESRENGPFGKYVLHRARFYSVNVSKDLLKYTPTYSTESKKATIPNEILTADVGLKKVFLRAFWDDEGSITIDKNNVRILQATCPHNKIRKQLMDMHKEFTVVCGEADSRIIRITHQSNIRKFYEKIGFTPGIIISAKSKKWQGVEKSQLLEIVLNSYKRRK